MKVTVTDKSTLRAETRVFNVEDLPGIEPILHSKRKKESLSHMPTPIIFTHGSCFDGTASAWLFHRYYVGDVKIFWCQYEHGAEWERVDCKDREVVFVDFSAPRDVLCRIAAEAKSVLVIDHHKSAAAALANPETWAPSNMTVIFDKTRSGCLLAYDYLKAVSDAKRIPFIQAPLVTYVNDHDLWRFLMPDTRLVTAYLSSLPHSVDAYDLVNTQMVSGGMADILAKGSAIKAHLEQKILKAAKRVSIRRDHAGNNVAVYNCIDQISETAEKVLALHDSADYTCSWFDIVSENEVTRVHSLRSRPGSEIDVSLIAEEYGGGGHEHAAGFSQSIPFSIAVMFKPDKPCPPES